MELTTDRLVLRDFVAGDLDAYFAIQSDPRWLRYYEWTERRREDAQELMQLFLTFQEAEPRIKYQLAVTLDGELIGSCGLRMDAPDATEGDIGYEIAADLWGNGYATEAARAMMRFGFDDLGLHRVWSWCIADNAASAAVLRRIGLREEGRQRDKYFFKGRYWDTLLFGILEDEWRVSASS